MVHRALQTFYETYPALGSTIKLCLTATMSRSEADELFRELKKTIILFEKRCSRFLPSSELSLFNQKAGIKRGISPELRDVLVKAHRIGRQTNGLYNPFVLPSLQRAGYVHSVVNDYADDPTNDYSQRHLTPVTDIEIGDNWARIPHGTALDLGGCGKGYIGDQLADFIDNNQAVHGYWLSIGGDVVLRGIHETGKPIVVDVRDEVSNEVVAQIQSINRQRFGVATSTVMRRKGVKDGVSWHHIIDPRTGRPAESDIRTMTVCSDSLLAADVHATNCIIVGLDSVPGYLHKHAITEAVLQANDNTYRFYGSQVKGYIDKVVK